MPDIGILERRETSEIPADQLLWLMGWLMDAGTVEHDSRLGLRRWSVRAHGVCLSGTHDVAGERVEIVSSRGWSAGFALRDGQASGATLSFEPGLGRLSFEMDMSLVRLLDG